MIIASLKLANKQILSQLEMVLQQMDLASYAMPLDMLSGNTVGMHVRHVLELYLEFFEGVKSLEINYDERKRDLPLQENLLVAYKVLVKVKDQLDTLENDSDLLVKACFNAQDNLALPSSVSRELAYNLEHTIHHMAIIQICIKQYFSEIVLPVNFGKAYATIQYQNNHVHANVSATQ